MLKSIDAEQHISNLQQIESPGVREAYRYMIGHAACLHDYFCCTNNPQPKRDFRYYSELDSNEQPFAFIINHKSLLFYVRKPGLKKFDENAVKSCFPSAQINPRGEITIAIENLDDAQKVSRFFFK